MALTPGAGLLQKLGLHAQLRRLIATEAVATNNIGELAYEDAKPANSIPTEGFHKVLYMMLKNPEYQMKNHLMEKFLAEKHGDIFKLKVLGIPDAIFIRNPEDIRTLMYNDGKNPIEPGFDFFVKYRQELRKDLYPNPGLVGSHGEKWYEVRSSVQQDMMRPKSALYYIDEITDITNEALNLMVSKQEEKNSVDVASYTYRWSLESIGSIFLDTRLGCLQDPPPALATELIDSVNVALGDVILRLTYGVPLWKLYRTKDYNSFDKASESISSILSNIVHKAKNQVMADNSLDKKNRDDMSVLEKLIDKCGPDSKIPEIMANDAMMAGIDTTGNSSSFLLYHLASNPQHQEIVYQEIKEKLGDKKLTPKLLNELKYLKAFIHESQRLLPAVSGMSRITQKDMVLAGYQIPEGTRISMLFTNIMTDQKHFKDPEKFMPERWLRGSPAQHSAHPFAFIPFGHGARMCIGRRFAELEMQIMAIETLRRFKVEDASDKPLEMITPFVNRPDGPVNLKFKLR